MSPLPFACPRCRVAVAPKSLYCRACGAPLGLGRAMPVDERPPIWVTTENYVPLGIWARRHRAVAPALVDFLMGEIARAVVCAPEWIAPDVVTMNSRVEFTVGETGQRETRLLVYPDRDAPTGQTLSVVSPVGAALIGLAAGSAMTVADRQGDPLTVRVERVAYQPEAMRRHRAPAG